MLKLPTVRVVFEEVSIKATRVWKEDGKRRQQTRKFSQTIHPWNKNPDGTIKTREEITAELMRDAAAWNPEPQQPGSASCT